MRNLIGFFIKNPIWANAIILLTAIFGIISLFTINSSFFPERDPKKIFITVVYPGASPIEMEEGVTIKMEDALKGMEGVKEITSNSWENVSRITVESYDGVDLDELLAEVKNTVDGINNLPVSAEKPIVAKQKAFGMAGTAAYISLKGKGDLFAIKEMAEKIEDDFLASDEISQVTLYGYPELEFSIEVKEEALLRYGLTIDEVVNAVRMNNRDISAGTIKTNSEEFVIRSRARETDPEKLKKIPVRSGRGGTILFLSDIAAVRFKFSETPSKSYIDGERAVTFKIGKLPDEDIKAMAVVTKKYIAEFNRKHQDFQLVESFQFSDMLDERIDLLSDNGIIGLVLVLVVLGLFLSLRLSLWVAFGIPFSFLGMLCLGVLYGMTINMISLFGMILVVGILVDDGIVIAENIYAHYERGKSSYRAALDGTMEVLPSVMTSVLTTMVAFGSLMFLGGMMEMLNEMAFAVVACLGFSLIEAFLVLPSHLASKHILGDHKVTWYKKIRAKIEKLIDSIREGYAYLLELIIKNYRIHVFVPAAFILVIVFLAINGTLSFTFFPQIPFDEVKIEVAFKPGEREDKTEAFLKDCETKVIQVGEELIEETGDTLITYTSLSVGQTDGMGESGSHAGMIRVSMDVEGQSISSFEIANRIREKIGEVKGAEKFTVGGENRWGKPVQVALSSKNYEEIQKAKVVLKASLEDIGVLKDITDDEGMGRREILLELKPKAYILGLNHAEITKQVRQGFYGEEAQRLIIGNDEVKVWVRYPEEDRSMIGQLDEMKIKVQGAYYPIRELVDYTIERGAIGIKHRNGRREISVSADQKDPYASTTEITSEIANNVLPNLIARFPSVNMTFRGQAEQAEESMSSLAIMLSVAIFMIILILSLNFGSLYQARLILMVIPVGFASALLGHGIMHNQFSILSFWGIVALLGILINDAVVMLDKYNRNLKEGMTIKQAAFEAGKSRFRPILLTSLTTVIGLFPLIQEKSFQAQFLVPMAISVAFGVLFGTFFIMFYFPVLILYFNGMRRNWTHLWSGKKIDREKIEPVVKKMEKIQEIGGLQ